MCSRRTGPPVFRRRPLLSCHPRPARESGLHRLETARRVVDDVEVEVVVVILTEPEVARADYRNGQAELTLEWDQVQWARARVTFDHC